MSVAWPTPKRACASFKNSSLRATVRRAHLGLVARLQHREVLLRDPGGQRVCRTGDIRIHSALLALGEPGPARTSSRTTATTGSGRRRRRPSRTLCVKLEDRNVCEPGPV